MSVILAIVCIALVGTAGFLAFRLSEAESKCAILVEAVERLMRERADTERREAEANRRVTLAVNQSIRLAKIAAEKDDELRARREAFNKSAN